jgi:uncharacterized protein (TIGR00251 family)
VSALDVRERPGGVRLTVRVQPRARASAVDGVHGGALKVRVAAPPVDGAANAALVGFLAEVLGVRPRAVRIVSGDTARTKVVDIDGVGPAHVRRLIPPSE